MKTKIETETRTVEGNGWVKTGAYYSASFTHPQPATVKGCPLGRSQESMKDAIRDLVNRTNGESGTTFTVADLETVRHNGQSVEAPAPAPAPAPADLLPPDPEGRNEDRAGWARQALEHFRSLTGTDAEDALADLLANLRHLCDREPGTYGTYEDADARASRMHEEETADPAPAPAEDPPARVLHLKQDMAGQWMYQTRQGDRVSIPWQYGGFDREGTIRQARDRFSFDLVAPL